MDITDIEKMAIVVTPEQETAIKTQYRASHSQKQFFTADELITAIDKGYVNTLNNKPISIHKGFAPLNERFAGNKIVKLSNGMYAVASKTLLSRAGLAEISGKISTEKAGQIPEGWV